MATFTVDCFVDSSGRVVGCGAANSGQTSTNPYEGAGSNNWTGYGSGEGGASGYAQSGGQVSDGSGKIGTQNTMGIFEQGILSIPSPWNWDPFKKPIKGTNWVLVGLLVAGVVLLTKR